MTVPEDQSTSSTDRLGALAEIVDSPDETADAPTFVTASLGLVAAVLVAVSTLSAIEAGQTAIALSFLAAVGIFVGTVLVFEGGRRIGDEN